MSPERLAEIRSRYTRTTPDKPLWQEVCIDVSDLLREVDRLSEWLDVAAAAENANAKELRELRDLIALHGPVGAGNEADTLVEMKRLAFLDGLEAAAELCERRANGVGRYKTVEESALFDAADAIRDIVSKP